MRCCFPRVCHVQSPLGGVTKCTLNGGVGCIFSGPRVCKEKRQGEGQQFAYWGTVKQTNKSKKPWKGKTETRARRQWSKTAFFLSFDFPCRPRGATG